MARQQPESAGLNSSALSILLNRVHLKGLIEECVLSIKDGVASVYAVDLSNSVFVSCSNKIGDIEDTVLGLGKLSILCKFLEDGTDISHDITDKWLTLRKPGRGSIKTLLLEDKQVPTAVQGDGADATKSMLKLMTTELALEQGFVNDLISYLTLINCPSAVFRVKGGIVTVSNSAEMDQQFSLRAGKATESTEDATVEVYSQYLLAVLRGLSWPEKETPTINIGNEAPLIIKQDNKNIWALTPIVAS